MKFTSFFYTDTETVKYRELENLDSRSQDPPNLLETLSESIPEDESTDLPSTDNTQDRECTNLSPQARAEALYHI